MKSILTVCAILFLINLTGQAQGKYAQENLERLSSDELNTYLDEAQLQQKKGRNGILVGGSLITLGLCTVAFGGGELGTDLIGGAIAYTGVPVLLIGLPHHFIYKRRAKRMIEIKNTSSNDIGFTPTILFNTLTQTYQLGVTIGISF